MRVRAGGNFLSKETRNPPSPKTLNQVLIIWQILIRANITTKYLKNESFISKWESELPIRPSSKEKALIYDVISLTSQNSREYEKWKKWNIVIREI